MGRMRPAAIGLAKLAGSGVLLAGGIVGGLGYLRGYWDQTAFGVAVGLVGLLVLVVAFREEMSR